MTKAPDQPTKTRGTAPIATPPSSAKPTSSPLNKLPSITGPALVVVQWLTYAFWGWLLVALTALTAFTLTSLLDSSSNSHEGVPYALAAVIVLLPLAFVCDLLYGRNEPAKKTGAETAVMIVHAVIFAIFAITSLIIALFTVIGLLLNAPTDNQIPGFIALIITCLLATVYYAMAFVRTLSPSIVRRVVRFYKYAMVAIVGVTVIVSIVGPVARGIAARNDELIERNLSTIERAVDQYTRDNDELPRSLSDVTIDTTGGRQLISNNLVEYKNDGTEAGRFGLETHRYQLCVTYGASQTSGLYGNDRPQDGGYSSFVSTSNHPAGRVCYKLQVTGYDSSN